jgi:transcriptional regulator GlxA family with amidase domain
MTSATNRRDFLTLAASGAAIAFFNPSSARAADSPEGAKLTPPADNKITVAYALTQGANVIDTFGPWETFLNVMWDEGDKHIMPFQNITVAPTKDALRMGGGLRVLPQYTFGEAPQPHVIVVPAQMGNDALHDWLRKASAKADVTMSVCTGAFQLAKAGLLEGKAATTHHAFYDRFAKAYPDVELRRGLRFVDNGNICTAGGLTSGIDMALHVISRYYGRDRAVATAKYLEHQSTIWGTQEK